jgi:hypothetical protein
MTRGYFFVIQTQFIMVKLNRKKWISSVDLVQQGYDENTNKKVTKFLLAPNNYYEMSTLSII